MVVGVIQARMGSTRLPGKVLELVAGRSLLEWVIRAAVASRAVDVCIVATTEQSDDDVLVAHARELGAEVHRGSTDDVLSRFIGALTGRSADAVVRLTADCPLLDPAVIRAAVGALLASDLDYLSTVTPRSLPRGLDVEVVRPDALRRAGEAATGVDRVHVTSHIYGRPESYAIGGLVFAPDASDLRVTVDTAEDLQLVRAVVDDLGDGPHGWRDVVRVLRARDDLVAINAGVRQKGVHEG